MIRELVATACLIWYVPLALFCALGYIQISKRYSRRPPPAKCLSTGNEDDVPHVTVIRPVKGRDPFLYDCLAATFRQAYPKNKLTVYFCVSSRSDPSYPLLNDLIHDFSEYDARVFVADEDPHLQELDSRGVEFGPNPKIRNVSRAYREAKGDIVWCIDCNVWVGGGVAGRMVDKLCGCGGGRKNKLVHQLPFVVDTSDITSAPGHHTNGSAKGLRHARKASLRQRLANLLATGGTHFEELFMSSAHAKFYTAINTVLLAPCIVGKSNMFRRSHLNALTDGKGLDYFAHNICEDHLIGDLLWKREVPPEIEAATESECGAAGGRGKWGQHALVPHDPAIQPMEFLSVYDYMTRRTRWLRVRKFTVTLATLVEPGTECLLSGIYGAYAATTLPFFHTTLGIPQTWLAFWACWALHVLVWAAVDRCLYRWLHAAASIEIDEHTPRFAREAGDGPAYPIQRNFRWWLGAWLGREVLAFPIWFWAVWGGTSVTWRGKRFWVGTDMRVHAYGGDWEDSAETNGVNGKDGLRID